MNHDKMDVKDHRKLLLVGENASQAAETPGKCRKSARLLPGQGENHEK